MKWTKQKPTKIGWYWYEDGLCDYPTVGKVKKDGDEFWFDDGDELIFMIGKGKETDETRWSDAPIKLPQ